MFNLDNTGIFKPRLFRYIFCVTVSNNCCLSIKNKDSPGHRAREVVEIGGSQAQVELRSLEGKSSSSVGRWWKSLLSTKSPKDKAAVTCRGASSRSGQKLSRVSVRKSCDRKPDSTSARTCWHAAGLTHPPMDDRTASWLKSNDPVKWGLTLLNRVNWEWQAHT